MEKRIVTIQNFGPIQEAKIDLNKRFQIYMGAQASGKSTICKVLYFCMKTRDYTLEYLMDSKQFEQNHKNEYFNNYLKYLTKKFMGCFGTTKHMKAFYIEYCFGKDQINICLNKDGYVRFRFSGSLKGKIQDLIDEASEIYLETLKQKNKLIVDNIIAYGIMLQRLQTQLYKVFENSDEIIYIPAGRSLLATMSEQLHDFTITDMDLTMQEFINLIRKTKSRFGNKMPDMVQEYTKTVKGQINNLALERAYELIQHILKADYTSDSDGEKIYFDQSHWVKLMYGSSGQQEALWILMLLFISILENKKSFIVIEEPEAHLFPIAQKEMVNLIALMMNITESHIIITTHSPYILTSANILLYAGKVEKKIQGKSAVVLKSERIDSRTVCAYALDGIRHDLMDLMDDESGMIDTEYIDSVSIITNDELEELFKRETAGLHLLFGKPQIDQV